MPKDILGKEIINNSENPPNNGVCPNPKCKGKIRRDTLLSWYCTKCEWKQVKE